MRKFRVGFTCPICGFENDWMQEFDVNGKFIGIAYCNSEIGGCDNEFVVQSKLIAISNVSKLDWASYTEADHYLEQNIGGTDGQ